MKKEEDDLPAKRKTRRDRVGDALMRRYTAGKALARLKEEDVAHSMGYETRRPLAQRRQDPLKFTLGDLMSMERLFGWTAEDWLYILRAEELKGGQKL